MGTINLMGRGHARMHVLPAKLQEYLDAGWVVLERIEVEDAPPMAKSTAETQEEPQKQPKAKPKASKK